MSGGEVLLKRFYHEGLAQASWLVGCQKTGEALVLDPNRDLEPYLATARADGMRIVAVTETHIHADYLSGSRELAAHTGATLHLSAAGPPAWQYSFAAAAGARLLRDGDEIRVGNLRLDVVHTPGHTPEHLTFVCTDLPASDQPLGAFTGDFLFVGDVGRPDLLERAAKIEGTMREGAAQLHESLRRFSARYPDWLQIWPGHGSGSACGKALGAVPTSTLGYERVANWALQLADREAFIAAVLEGQPDPPPYFAVMKQLNRDGPPPRPRAPLPSLPPGALRDLVDSGAFVLDVRPGAAFAERHWPGSRSIPLGRSFLTWAGWLAPRTQDLFLLAADAGQAEAARGELALIGLDRCAGWFDERALDDPAARPLATMSVDTLAKSNDGVQVIDVRAADEYVAGHLPGARHIPLGRLEERLAELDLERPVVLQCQGGSRSAIAASLLEAHGARAPINLAGGFAAWSAAGHPVRTGPDA